MANIFTFDALASFAALTFLEIVLSVDNILFVALAAARLPAERRHLARQLGLTLAMALRLGLLCALVWVSRLQVELFAVAGRHVSLKDLILIGGGLFLIYKASTEIHETIDLRDSEAEIAAAAARPQASVPAVIAEIGVINIVFSLDSVITAIGMARQLAVMAAAVAVATLLMMLAARPVGDFIERRPTARMLGLAFILLVGVVLIADGTGFDVPRGYLYFAIAFSLLVEALNTLRLPRRKRGPATPGP